MGTLPSYPPATLPLGGTDMVPVWQNGAQKTVHVDDLLVGAQPMQLLLLSALAAENLAAGAFVHIDMTGATVRKAFAGDPTLWANGFVAADINSGEQGIIAPLGWNAAVSVSSASQVWLSDTVPGQFASTPPTTPGSIVQPLSLLPALPGSGILFTPLQWIQL